MNRSRLAVTACLLIAMPLSMLLADDWLIDAPDEASRVQRLSDYLGGFSKAMWEVGDRFEKMTGAIARDNFELAAYHWEKIGAVIRAGYMKRPARRANADELFIDTAWPAYLETLRSGDGERIRRDFARAREACMACHAAEGVAFMNDQPLFDPPRFQARAGKAAPDPAGERADARTAEEDDGGLLPSIRFRLCPDPDEPCWDED